MLLLDRDRDRDLASVRQGGKPLAEPVSVVPKQHTKISIIAALAIVLSGICAPAGAFEDVRFLGIASVNKLRATDVAFLPSGELLVLDGGAARVYVFGKSGALEGGIGSKGRNAGQLMRPVAVAVDVDSRILVADAGASRVSVFDRGGDFSFSFGSRGTARGQFRDLVAIETDHFGFIYVADRGNSNISRFARSGVLLDVIDLPSPPEDIALDLQLNVYVLMPEIKQIQLWRMNGQRMGAVVPREQNMLDRAGGFAVDGRGDIYVADGGSHRMLKFDREGNRLVAFGSKGRGTGQFSSPSRIVADPGRRVAIADQGNNRAQIFEINGPEKPRIASAPSTAVWRVERESDIALGAGISDLELDASGRIFATRADVSAVVVNGERLSGFEQPGRKEGQLRRPRGLDIGPEGQIVVADTGNHRVQVFNRNGFVRSFGTRGTGPGEFDSPQDVAVGTNGYIYISDSGNHRIQVFNDQGILLTWFGGTDKEGARGRFKTPTALEVDRDGHLLVLDTGNRRVQIFDDQGRYVDAVTGFQAPVDIALDEEDRLLVADRGCNCVRVFTPDRRLLLSFGGVGSGPGRMMNLSTVLSLDSRVYVGFENQNLVKVFRISNDATLPEERMSYTHNYAVPDGTAGDERAALRREAFRIAAGRIASELKLPLESVIDDARIVSERPLARDMVEMTLTVSKHSAPGPLAPAAAPMSRPEQRVQRRN